MAVPKLTLAQKAAKSANNAERKLNSSCSFVILILLTALLYFALLFVTYLAANPNLSGGLFKRGISNVSDEYPLNITPAGWAFSIWGVIFLLQFAWVLYSLALLCRKSDDGPAYLDPVILSPALLIFFSLSSIFNVGWLFLWDRLLLLASGVFLGCIALSLSLTFSIGASNLVQNKAALIDQGRRGEYKFLVSTLLNGVAMYMTWTVIATLLNVGIVFTYKFSTPIANEDASIICLGILSFVAVVYIGLDVSVLERYTRYCLTPYMVVIWALSAIIANNFDQDKVSSIISVVLLGSVSLSFLIKVALTFYRANGEQYQYKQMKMGRPKKGQE